MNAAIVELLSECKRRGVRLLPTEDGNVTIDAPANETIADLITRVRDHKPQLVRVLNGNALRESDNNCDFKNWEQLEEPGNGCDNCGSIMIRWDLRGQPHCMDCRPSQSSRVLALVKRLRK